MTILVFLFVFNVSFFLAVVGIPTMLPIHIFLLAILITLLALFFLSVLVIYFAVEDVFFSVRLLIVVKL